MEHAGSLPYLQEILIFLVAAGIVVPVFQRLRVSPVLGFLLVGVAVGPHGFGRIAGEIGPVRHAVIQDVEAVQPLAELGIVFLLFIVGLELSFRRLWALRTQVFGLGTAQVAVTAVAITALGLFFGNALPGIAIVGTCLALSSTAIVIQLLIEHRRLGTQVGRTAFAILLLQDLAVVPILVALDFLAPVDGVALGGADAAWAVGRGLVVIAAITLVGSAIVRPLFRLVGSAGSRDLFMAMALLVVIGTAAATGAAGLSMALGAFLGGVLLAETEYRHAVEVDLEPFKGLLLGLFFMTVGMRIDPAALLQFAAPLAVSVIGLFLVKSAILTVLCLAFGLPRHAAVETGLLLGQAGEFGLLVVALSIERALLAPGVGQFMLLVIGLSMLATPLVAWAARRLAAAIERPHADADAMGAVPGDLADHVIIAGFGRVGQTVGELIDGESIPYLALDLDAQALARHRRAGRPVFFGDACRPDMLRMAGAARAQAVVITLDEARQAERCVRAIRQHWPDLAIYARARDGGHAGQLARLGVREVVPEAVEASLQLGGRVLMGIGVPETAVIQRLDQARDRLTRG